MFFVYFKSGFGVKLKSKLFSSFC